MLEQLKNSLGWVSEYFDIELIEAFDDGLVTIQFTPGSSVELTGLKLKDNSDQCIQFYTKNGRIYLSAPWLHGDQQVSASAYSIMNALYWGAVTEPKK